MVASSRAIPPVRSKTRRGELGPRDPTAKAEEYEQRLVVALACRSRSCRGRSLLEIHKAVPWHRGTFAFLRVIPRDAWLAGNCRVAQCPRSIGIGWPRP